VILVDTSVWIDHLRSGDTILTGLLDDDQVLAHPFIIGELALGNLRQRETLLADLRNLPQALAASDAEVLHFIQREGLFGIGIGYLDSHLLAATRLTQDASLWTRDKRLSAAAERLSLAARGMD
jgi:predicted nucleic acid-binding protein